MHYHIAVAVIWAAVFVESRKIRGISLSYKRFYKERKSFLCIDGSKLIPFEQVNDDYCDCADGSDEPGTAACPNGHFYCTNLGFRPHYIQSSRVNDGICDCCDGSDEYNSSAHCQNTCRNLGQRERAELEKRMRRLNEGLLMKRQLVEEGADVWREKQAELSDLQKVAEDLQIRLEYLRKRKTEAEALKEEALAAAHPPPPPGQEGPRSPIRAEISLEGHEQPMQDTDILIDTDTRLQQWMDSAEQREESPKEPEVKDAGTEDDPDVKAAVEAAKSAVADLKKSEEAYQRLQMEIRELEDRLAIDYGPEREFLFLLGRCFQITAYEYAYTICPFNQVTQKSQAGTEVLLGKWDAWGGPPENPYGMMKYDRGEPCWQGPTRSTHVRLTCGADSAVRWVKEPSKCHYAMELQTPVACRPQPPSRRGVHSEL
ncbi:glucosidase 2 subunit beta-like isoform X3 [Alosa sapidissima]|uniref:glucosidase 2 subunit beta-like isoform X3 n=1 Tax=Alosa sapidissima TaxID=34773 RepID=UPI001C09C490|nr:glucosidase 2 subunit beta-like isoform X3 [Alosa sapidissima]